MNKIILFLKSIWRANPKTIYFNFKYLPWQQAIHFPIWVSSNTVLHKTKGEISINTGLKTGMIRIGYGNIGLFDKKRSRTIWEVSGTVIFEGNTDIGHGSKIVVGQNGVLSFGKNFSITAESTLVAFKKITFGDDCLISWDVLFMDTDFHPIMNANTEILNPPSEIVIGKSVWIGCRSVILKGSTIPDGCIIAANSLVSKKLTGENQIFGSQSLHVIKQNIQWSKYE